MHPCSVLDASAAALGATNTGSVHRERLSVHSFTLSLVPLAKGQEQPAVVDYRLLSSRLSQIATWYQTVIVRGYQRAEVWACGSLTTRSWKRVGLVHVIYQVPDQGCAVTQRPPISSPPAVYTHNLTPGSTFAGLIAHASL